MAKKHDNTFFFKLEPSQLLSALILIPESERGAWITKVAVELATKNPVDPFAKQLFEEAQKFKQDASERSRQAGLASAEKRRLQALAKEQQKSTDVEHLLTDDEQLFDECQQPVNETQPISISSSISNTEAEEETKNLKPLSEYSDDFLLFWKAYPKKVAKGAAWKEWKKERPSVNDVLDALEWQTETQKWKDGYILDPERYIKKRCWEDEPDELPKTTDNTYHPPNLLDDAIRYVTNKNKHPVISHDDDRTYLEPTPEQIKMQDEVWARMMGK